MDMFGNFYPIEHFPRKQVKATQIRKNYFKYYSDLKFSQRFRISKKEALKLLTNIKEKIKSKTTR